MVLADIMERYSGPDHRTSTLLRRWVWRDAVGAGRVPTPDLGPATTALSAAQTILSAVPAVRSHRPDLSVTDVDSAVGRVNILGLLSAEPLAPGSGEPVNLARLLDFGSPLRFVVPAGAHPLSRSLANAVVWDDVDPPDHRLATVAPEVAASHLIDAEGQRLLAAGDDGRFLEHRAGLVERAIREHVDRMAEWGARDGESVRDVLRAGDA
jgi:hypothetical protein